MILISRVQGESIVIGDDIVVTVMEVQDDKVRLSIEYPPGVQVERKEVFQTIDRGLETPSPP